MLRRHHHVLLPGTASQPRPIARGVRLGLELIRELFILADRDALILHHPLVATKHTVESPVNEHAELGLVPPLHPARAVGDC